MRRRFGSFFLTPFRYSPPAATVGWMTELSTTERAMDLLRVNVADRLAGAFASNRRRRFPSSLAIPGAICGVVHFRFLIDLPLWLGHN